MQEKLRNIMHAFASLSSRKPKKAREAIVLKWVHFFSPDLSSPNLAEGNARNGSNCAVSSSFPCWGKDGPFPNGMFG